MSAKSPDVKTPWLIASYQGKLILSLSDKLGEHKNKIEANLKEHKGTYEREIGHVCGRAVKVSAGLAPEEIKKALKEAVHHKSAKPIFEMLEPKIAAEREVKRLGPLKAVGLGFEPLSWTPFKASLQFEYNQTPNFFGPVTTDIDSVLFLGLPKGVTDNIHDIVHNTLKKMHAEMQWKLEIEVGIGPGPEAWTWLIETVGEPALELLIEVTPIALIAAAVASPFFALHSIFQAEKEGKIIGNCWNYAGTYAGTVFGGKLGSLDETWLDADGKKVTQQYRDQGERDAIRDAHRSVGKLLKGASASDKAALDIYGRSFKKDRKLKAIDEARRAMFLETYDAITKKRGVDGHLLRDYPPTYH